MNYSEPTNEELLLADINKFPYAIHHDEGEGTTPKFRTWREALRQQREWNKNCPGHRAYKRRHRPAKDAISTYLATIGAKGGAKKSPAKTAAARINASKPRKRKTGKEALGLSE